MVATSVIREKSMPLWTGHLLRRTHKTMALVSGVSDFKSSLLLHHKVGSISDVYTAPRRDARRFGGPTREGVRTYT